MSHMLHALWLLSQHVLQPCAQQGGDRGIGSVVSVQQLGIDEGKAVGVPLLVPACRHLIAVALISKVRRGDLEQATSSLAALAPVLSHSLVLGLVQLALVASSANKVSHICQPAAGLGIHQSAHEAGIEHHASGPDA